MHAQFLSSRVAHHGDGFFMQQAQHGPTETVALQTQCSLQTSKIPGSSGHLVQFTAYGGKGLHCRKARLDVEPQLL